MKKLVATVLVCLSVTAVVSGSAFAAKPGPSSSDPHNASVNNTNANPNACWGQDRSFYASEGFFAENMDIKQSLPDESRQRGRPARRVGRAVLRRRLVRQSPSVGVARAEMPAQLLTRSR